MTPLHQTGMKTSPENEPCCMRHSRHHAVHKPRRVSPKSFSETTPEKTRWPHQLPWKSRDPSAVISSLKVTCDSLLWLAKLPTQGTRSAGTLILFSCLSLCFSLLLLPCCSLHTLSICISWAFIGYTTISFSLSFLLHLILICLPLTFSLGIFAPHWLFLYPFEAFSPVSKIKTCPLWFPSEGPRQREI